MNKKQKKAINSGRRNLKIKFSHRIFSFFYQRYLNFIEKILLNYFRIKNSKNNFFNEPLISIYTPTFNRAKILKSRAIKSVLKQSYKNFEYIIVGDGCTDSTEKIVKKIKDKRIKFFKIEAEGAEPEVLEGSKNSLKIIDYIGVDGSRERGKKEESTIEFAKEFLQKNDFDLIKIIETDDFIKGLFKNKKNN